MRTGWRLKLDGAFHVQERGAGICGGHVRLDLSRAADVRYSVSISASCAKKRKISFWSVTRRVFIHARGDGHMFVRGRLILMHDTGDAVEGG